MSHGRAERTCARDVCRLRDGGVWLGRRRLNCMTYVTRARVTSLTGCATAECGWDGGDCNQNDRRVAPGSIVIIVALSPSDFRSVADDFVRNFSLLLHTVLTIQKVRHYVIAVVLAALT